MAVWEQLYLKERMALIGVLRGSLALHAFRYEV
jgi:hypothetical protein